MDAAALPETGSLARQEGRRYPVEVGEVLPARAVELAAGRDRVALVSFARMLGTPLGKKVVAALRREAPLRAGIALPDGERAKTLAWTERAAGRLLAAGLTRRSLVVALGGGAVTDAAGFLAAVFMRGLDWVALPTTLLAMVDAGLGGKTAVNLPVAKNAVGAFHPPRAVLSDPRTLRTLPPRELRSGFGEALKYGLLRPGYQDNLQLGYMSYENDNAVVSNNYLAGGCATVNHWTNLTLVSNTFAGFSTTFRFNPSAARENYTWNNNRYFLSSSTPFSLQGTLLSFAGWKSATGFDTSSELHGHEPTGVDVFVRPNAYERGRANIIVYNWDLKDDVPVNLSGVLSPGDRFEIRNSQDFFGPAVLEGVFPEPLSELAERHRMAPFCCEKYAFPYNQKVP